MGQTLTVPLSDETIESIRREAAAVGASPAELAATPLEQRFAKGGAGRGPTSGPLSRYFGSVDLGHATGADNESIDADLAREYLGAEGND